MTDALAAMGIGRDPEDERTLFVIFNRAPSDDEVDAIHAQLGMPAADRPPGTVARPAEAPGGNAADAAREAEEARPFAPVEAYGDVPGARNHAAEAAMKCQEPAFKKFLEERHGLERPLTDERAVQKLRSLLGVTSRRELNEGGAAVDRWKRLKREFDAWRRAG